MAYLASPEAPLPSGTAKISGTVDYIVDGDTIDIAGQRLRLVGIDAPEREQTCGGANGETWDCGAAASRRLAALLRGKLAVCQIVDRDRYGRLVGRCSASGGDPADLLVREGLAIALTDYRDAEAVARGGRIGLWQGAFQRPAEWRQQAETGRDADTAAPSRFQRFLDWLWNGVLR